MNRESAQPLTIIELCLSNGRGGLEHYAAELVPALSERGHRLIVVARADTEFATRAGQIPTLTLEPHRYLRWLGAKRLAALARDTEADLIHIHRSADLPLAVLAKAQADKRTALIYTRHMLITRKRLASPAHRYMFARVDRLLPITEQIAAAARRDLPIAHERIVPLAPGVAPTARTADPAQVRPPGSDFVVGCFSRIEAAKGQHELVAAIAGLRARGIRAGGVFAGPVMNATYDTELARRVKALGLEESIRFLGALPDARPVMACCDAVAMPSSGEALGLVLVEAMLMGVPAVGSAAGGVPEFIRDGKTGLTYPAGDIEALTDQLQRLATDPAFAHALAAAGRRAAGARFDREAHLDRLEAIFRSAVKQRAPCSLKQVHA